MIGIGINQCTECGKETTYKHMKCGKAVCTECTCRCSSYSYANVFVNAYTAYLVAKCVKKNMSLDELRACTNLAKDFAAIAAGELFRDW